MLEKQALTRAPQPTDRHIGSRIRLRRRELGISQAALGEAVGVTFQQIQKYEKGDNRVGAGRLLEIAEALRCQPAWFFEGGPPSSRVGRAHMQYDPETPAIFADADVSELIRSFVRLPPQIKRGIADLTAAIAGLLEQP
jgi:transcriptional regulator with XRE-family HTH domain